ncbi:MAG: glycosyltransferase family 4 protein [Gemmataceae bacterium]|nr:glycosyltransferase family 4 protein [Gemmataceae bacterium]MCI0743384.1 glycosyltransferase family 4 protein [Gemmataceae bacterium]
MLGALSSAPIPAWLLAKKERANNQVMSIINSKCFHQILGSRELGGAGLVALHTAAFLRDESQTSPVWVPGDGPALRTAKDLDLQPETYDLKHVFGTRRIRAAWESWRFGRRLRRRGAGLVHTHSLSHYGALHLGLKWSGLKRIVHVHLEEPEAYLRWALKRPPELIITCAQFLVEHARRCLPERFRERQRIVALPNAVNTQRFYPGDRQAAKQRLGAPLDQPLALMLANLAPHKGQETTVRAVALLKQRGVRVQCWLAGTEREEHGFTQRLQALIGELGVADRVRLLGYRDDAPELLRAADFFLLPSTCEGLPLTVVEAQASKVPVLAAPTAGIPEVVQDGETGILIRAEDAEGYARRLEDLINHPESSRRIAERAFERTTRKHNWRNYCERLWELYQGLLGMPIVRAGTDTSDDVNRSFSSTMASETS